jgi:hypothetical protein
MGIYSIPQKRFGWQRWNCNVTGCDSSSSGGSSLLYTEVPVSSAQILAIHATPVQLLPELAAGQYYDNIKMNLEFTAGATPYTVSGNGIFLVIANVNGYFDNGFQAYFDSQIIENPKSNVTLTSIHPIFSNQSSPVPSYIVNKFNTTKNVDDPSLSNYHLAVWGKAPLGAFIDGDGTLLVKIWYEVRTMGTEL